MQSYVKLVGECFSDSNFSSSERIILITMSLPTVVVCEASSQDRANVY